MRQTKTNEPPARTGMHRATVEVGQVLAIAHATTRGQQGEVIEILEKIKKCRWSLLSKEYQRLHTSDTISWYPSDLLTTDKDALRPLAPRLMTNTQRQTAPGETLKPA